MPNLRAQEPEPKTEPAVEVPHLPQVHLPQEAAFLPMQGGQGLQLHFGGGNGGFDPHGDDLLLIGGDDLRDRDHHQSQNGILGKRNNGMHRIHSEPQFLVSGHEKDFFQQDYFGGIEAPAPILEMVHQAPSDLEHMQNDDLGNLDVTLGLDFFNNPGASLFEDEELALASLEFSRPKKMSKSVSTGHLGTLVHSSAFNFNDSINNNHHHHHHSKHHYSRHNEKNDEDKRVPETEHGKSYPEKLGPLGHPIRRINTFTTNLPSFQEEDRNEMLHSSTMKHSQYHSSEDDLVRQLLDPMSNEELLVQGV